jgi:hypothetical protein
MNQIETLCARAHIKHLRAAELVPINLVENNCFRYGEIGTGMAWWGKLLIGSWRVETGQNTW